MNYQRIYDSLIARAKNRIITDYVEKHHIIPRCIGGSDDKTNLVELTPEEHFVAHILLVKIYPDHRNLILAVNKMTQGVRRTRKMYGWLRRKFSERIKELQAGTGNSQFGSYWVYNELGETKKCRGNVPAGYQVGRSPKQTSHCSCGGLKTKYRKNCSACSRILRRKFTDAEIIEALEKSETQSISEVARLLGVKNPHSNIKQRRRISTVAEKWKSAIRGS